MDIPKDFYSYDTGKPFENCLICGTHLHTPPQRYMVEKCIRRYPDLDSFDVIYEYALCFSCTMKQQEYISKESLQNLMDYMSKIQNPMQLARSMETGLLPDKCLIHNTDVSEMSEYIIQGTFYGSQKDMNTPYFLFGDLALEEMQGLMSQKTRDGMDDFIDTYFSGPPEFRELLRERKTVLI